MIVKGPVSEILQFTGYRLLCNQKTLSEHGIVRRNLINDFSLARFLLFFAIAFGLEAVGTLIMLHFTNLNAKTKINFAVTMNARGGPGIVLATVAYAYEIINIEFFTVLILTTMLSSR